MLQLEVVVVVVGLGSETDLLHNYLCRLGLDFLGLLLLLVEIFLIVENLAYRRLCVGRDFHQVELELFGYLAGFMNGVYAWCHVVADKTHLACVDVLVDVVRRLFHLARVAALWAAGSSGSRGRAGRTGVEGWFFLHSGDYWLII